MALDSWAFFIGILILNDMYRLLNNYGLKV